MSHPRPFSLVIAMEAFESLFTTANNMTVNDGYLLPLTTQTLKHFARMKYFATISLASFFNEIRIQKGRIIPHFHSNEVRLRREFGRSVCSDWSLTHGPEIHQWQFAIVPSCFLHCMPERYTDIQPVLCWTLSAPVTCLGCFGRGWDVRSEFEVRELCWGDKVSG